MTSMIHIQAELWGDTEPSPPAQNDPPGPTGENSPVEEIDADVWSATERALLAFKARPSDECPACFEVGLSGQHDRACPIRIKGAA
ncbi:hypothetical protein [Streptomyces sp. NPDC057686]|uniref:hypothetical protein n=1 Tax=Streptomyces sp. NPDC057686 TaxID=3346212 RepID=UPI0036A1E890